MKLAILTCLLSAAVVQSAPPVLVVPPDPKPVSGYVRFSPQTDAKSVTYVALDDAYPFPTEELKDSRRFVLPVAGLKAGLYRFVAVGTLNDEQTATAFVVAIGGAVAPDPVKPTPPPDVKKAERVAVVVVEESMTRTVEQAKTMTDLRRWCDAGGHTLFVVDKDDPAATKNGYLPHAKELPAVLVFDQVKGGVLSVFKLPADGGAFRDKVKEVVK